jgi:hypothetical protein
VRSEPEHAGGNRSCAARADGRRRDAVIDRVMLNLSDDSLCQGRIREEARSKQTV